MARHNMNTMMTTSEMVLALLAVPFQRLGEALARHGARSARAQWLAQLNATSDAELAAKGLTRAQAAQMMLRSQF